MDPATMPLAPFPSRRFASRSPASRRPAAAVTSRRSPAVAAPWTTSSPRGDFAAARSRSGWPTAKGRGRRRWPCWPPARRVARAGRWSWWTADGHFYPPAAVRLGIALDRLLLVRVDNRADHDWALDQALRCPAVAAVMAWPEALAGRLDGRTFRRLQLAAEAEREFGPAAAAGRACGSRPPGRTCGCWSSRGRLSSRANRRAPPAARAVALSRRREGRSVELEFDDETHPVLTAAPEGAGGEPARGHPGQLGQIQDGPLRRTKGRHGIAGRLVPPFQPAGRHRANRRAGEPVAGH